jgi:hypothetical protein
MVQFPDGTLRTAPLAPDLPPLHGGVKRLVYDTKTSNLAVTLPEGDEVDLEALRPDGRMRPPRGPVVYLDQLHWVELARQLWAPEKALPKNREAAARLIELARNREITLPISSGNTVEMTQLDGRRRRHMATNMLGLSRGWQMRNPVDIRGCELRSVLSGDEPSEEAFSLAPGAIFSDAPLEIESQAGFPPEWQALFEILTSLNATVAMMLEDEKTISHMGRGMAAAWAESHHALAIYMRDQKMPKEKVRLNARAKLIADLASEIGSAAAGVGLSQEQLTDWLENDFEEDLARMPYLSRYHQVVYQRLRDANDRWERNDLIDVNFLACAAGYADVVVAEAKIGAYLMRVRKRVPEGAFVCRRLPEAVEHLEDRLGHAASPMAAQ